MRRFLPVFPNNANAPLLAAALLGVFPAFSVPAAAQTKPSVQVPATNRTQAQSLVQQLLREGKIMRGRDVKRGMKGYGLSVFQGTTIEKFPIEIIGVLESVNGGGDFVLFRVTGGTVIKRQSSIVAGMSGSPVYINGKLLGAIAIGFGFPKEAIGGITPITDMITTTLPDPARTRVVSPSGATKPASNATKAAQSGKKVPASNAPISSTRNAAPKPISATKINLETPQSWRPREPLKVAGRNITRVVVSHDRTLQSLSGDRQNATMTMHPATMLLQVSGVSASALPRLQKTFAPYGLEPIIGAGTSFGGGKNVQVFNMSSKKTGVDPAFIPGGAIGAQMVSGDMDMTGVGTITYRIGNRVLAFGHPLLGLGSVSLPMTSAYVHDIFPSYNSSFKLASPVRTLGAIQQDTNFAIGGTVGVKADTIPMTVTIRNPQRQIAKTYRVQIMKDPVLTPQLVQTSASEMIESTLGKDNDKMVSISLRMKLQGQPDVVRRNLLYAPSDIASVSLNDLGEALMVTQSNSFARGAIQGVTVNVDVAPTRRTARIKNIFADRNKIKAGQTVRVSVEMEPTTAPGTTLTKTFDFAVPSDAPTGSLRIAAGSSSDYWGLATRVGNAPPDPQNLRELLDAYSLIGSNNELMVQASTPNGFLVVDRTRVPNPPASWARLLRQSSSSSVVIYNETQTRRANIEYSLSGNQFLIIPVESIKHSDQVAADASSTTTPGGETSGATSSSFSTGETTSTMASDSPFGDEASIGGLKSLPAKLFGHNNANFQAESATDSANKSAPNAAKSDATKDVEKSGFAAFEKELRRGLGRSTFAGARFSPISFSNSNSNNFADAVSPRQTLNFEYSIRSSARVSPRSQNEAQDIQIPAPTPNPLPSPTPLPPVPTPPSDPNAPAPPNVVQPAPSATPTPLVPGLSATPTATPIVTPSPTPTPNVDNGTNLGRPSLRWTQSTAAEFTRGDFKGAQVTSEGAIQISPNVRQIATTAEPFAWSVAGDKNGNTFVGTGNSARIIKITSSGARSVLYSGKEVGVTALVVDDAGNLYAGVSPGGRVLKFAPNSAAPVIIFQSKDTFVWALKLDNQGRLLVATGGESGNLYRLDKPADLKAVPALVNGKLPISGQIPGNVGSLLRSPFVSVSQKHIRAITTRGNDIFFGTSEGGVLYRVDGATAKVTALYEVTSATVGDFSSIIPMTPDTGSSISITAAVAGASAAVTAPPATPPTSSEVLAVAALPDGVYFGTSTSGSLYRWTENGVSVVYPTPQNSIYSLQVAPDGSLIAGTGEKGIVYQFRTAVNANDTTGARLLEPTQTQALALAMAPDGDLLIGTGNNAAVYRAALGNASSGIYTSNVFDAKNIVKWGALRTIGSGISLETRSGNTLDPDATWSDWQNASRNDLGETRVASPDARYLQYRATLNASTANAAKKPQLSRIEVTYRGRNNAPQVAWTAPAGGEYWNATEKLTWQAQDADSDRLRSTLSISSDDGATWKSVELKTPTTPSFDLVTSKFPDGTYRFKVEVSDILSNPDDPKSDEQISAPVTIDNTAPTLTANFVSGAMNSVSATITDATSPISGAEWRFVGANATPKPTPSATPKSAPNATQTPTSSTRTANTSATTTPKVPAKTAAITLKPTATATPAATPTPVATSADWQALSATDGIFDSRRESVTGSIENSDLEAARTKFGAALQIEIRARDAAGNSVTTKIAVPAKTTS